MGDSLPRKIIVPEDVLVQDLSGEMVLLNLANEHYYGLDPIGTRMWQLLAENGDSEAMIPQLLSEFEIDEATLRRDVTRLLGELQKAGLVTIE